jgi:hypothetical protein
MFTDESHTAAALFSGDIDGGPALPPLADAGIAPMKATDPQQVYHLLNKIHTGMLARSAYLQGYPVTTSLETRACVTGFADDETKDWLDELLHAAGRAPGATKYKLASVFETYGPGCIEYDRSGGDDNYRNLGRCWVERIDGVETARIGAQMTAKQVYQTFPTGPSLQRELRKAWQITICAPTWGCGCMFADLLPLLVRHRRPAATAV